MRLAHNPRLDAIIEDAKRDPRKRSYQVYERYKQQIYDVATCSIEVTEGCKRLAEALKV